MLSTGVGTDRSRRALAVFSMVGVAVAYTLWRGVWPGIYTFATDQSASLISRLLGAPIHLSDDVMLTMRSGEILLKTGAPAFNLTDVAQASTSYLAPYVAALVEFALPANFAAAAFAFAGLAAVVAMWTVIAASSRSLMNAAILVGALALTATNLDYTLNGWDHLLQGLFFVIGVVLALSERTPLTTGRLVTISLLAAGGSLARPDGIVIAAALLWVAVMRSDVPLRRRLVAAVVPFALVVVGMLGLNLMQFGHLTPTTARLKAGAVPSADWITRYLLNNTVYAFTAITLLVLLLLVMLLFRRSLPMSSVLPLALASVVTAVIAAVNSDIFPSGRMFWVPAVTVGTALTVTLPGVLQPGAVFRRDEQGRIVTRLPFAGWWVLSVLGVGAAILGAFAVGLQGAVVSKEEVPAVRTAQQFLATEWINANLKPQDGSVGLFFAGEAAHLPDFEIADFLGKADEVIASQPVQWGPPGHNKWNIDATLGKWRPQIILPTVDQDPTTPEADTLAADWRENQWAHGYFADLITNPKIRADYRYCRVPDPNGYTTDTVDVYLRKDVAQRFEGQITCSG